MPIQAPQWTEFLSCPVCYNVFNEEHLRPISLACGHTVCRTCLSKFQQKKCPFDQSLISRDIDDLPTNFALLQLVSVTASPDIKENCVPDEFRKYYDRSRKCVEELALLLKPISSSSTGSIIPVSTSSSTSSGAQNCVLSRPMQRKLITLVNCQLVEDEGRARALRAARSLGERTVTELILQHQNPQQLSSNLWAAVRGRGCQFLGPGMQEEVLKLILLALEDGSALSRKVLVLFVVQRLEAQYPQASKTAIGHVVQLLYRASCFKVTKREEESSLMQLKEEYRTYDSLRREHDSQIVQIAMEAGLRIAPDQWSSLLYGDSTHKSHMQSIIDKLQTPQTFSQSVSELLIALQRTGDPYSLSKLRPELEFLSNIDPSPDVPSPTWENLDGVLRAVKTVIEGLVRFLQSAGVRKPDLTMPFTARYKTSFCRDFMERGHCPRANSCTFAHSEVELEKYRQKSRKTVRGPGSYNSEDRSRMENIDGDGSKFPRNDGRLTYSQCRGQLTGPPPQLAQPPQITPPQHLAPPTPQLVQPPIETPAGQVVDGMPVDVTGNVVQQPVEMLLSPGGMGRPTDNIVHPGTPTANFVMPSPGYVTPVDPSLQPPVGGSPSAPLPPNGDTAIVQAGNAIPAGSNVILQQDVPHGMVPPQPPVAANPQGLMQQPVNLEMQPGAVMQGGSPAVPPNMSQMPGMMYPYMPPYAPPGAGMMGPRFSMHPMMYGQYPYPPIHPFMAYYQQGFMPHDSSQMQYDNYYTSLNPFAEPWKPGMARALSHDSRSHGLEKCCICSQRDEEEQRRRHLCDTHKNENDTSWKHTDKTKIESGNKQNLEKETTKYSVDQVKSANKQQYHNGYRTSMTQESKNSCDSSKTKKFSEEQSYSYQNEVKHAAEEPQPEWSINDDDEGDDESEKGVSDYYNCSPAERNKQQKNNEQLKRQPSSQEQLSDEQEDWLSSQSDYSSKDKTSQKNGSFTSVPASAALNASKTPPIPLLSEPNAKLYRQSLNNLREKRNSLIQQLQEINKEATAHEHKLEELSESLPNLFRFEPQAFKEFSDGSLKEATVYASTLQHPEPLDTGPFSLKKAAPTNGEIFERLGAISGVPPRSVNDSIMASWTAKTLKYSESDSHRVEPNQSEAYSHKKPLTSLSSKTVPSSNAKVESSPKWNNVDKDFPYWKDVTQNLDSPMTTPPNTPCPSSISSSHSELKLTSSMLTGPYTSSYQPASQPSRSMTNSHRAEPVYSTSASVYGQSMSYSTKMSSGSGSSGSRPSTYVSSSSKQNNSGQSYSNSDNYLLGYSSASHVTTSLSSARMSVPQTVSYTGDHEQKSKSKASYWPSNTVTATALDVTPTSSYVTSSATYDAYGNTPQIYSSSQYSNFQSSAEEDHIPFVEGSPIISKYGPISRSVNKNVPQNTQPVKAVADEDASKTVPITAVTPLEGPPLPTTQKVPSRFTPTEDGQIKPRNKSSSSLTAYEKSYSLWTTELNLLEQKAKKASTEDEKLTVKLQAVQMQIALKEQELQQAQIIDSSMRSEYLKNIP